MEERKRVRISTISEGDEIEWCGRRLVIDAVEPVMKRSRRPSVHLIGRLDDDSTHSLHYYVDERVDQLGSRQKVTSG